MSESKDLAQGEKLDIELRDLYAANGTYTPEEKIQAVMAYMVTGTSRKASKICGVPEGTIRWWKSQSMWWDDTMAECRRKKQDELDAMSTDVIHKAVGKLAQMVDEGETVLTKEGQEVKIPLSAKQLTLTYAILFDKRQLLRGDPTSRTANTSDADRLKELQNKFEQMAQNVQGINAKTINNAEFEVLDEESDDERKSE